MAQFSVTIDKTKVTADQTDFPVYINLADMPAGFWSVVASGGGDIRCYKIDGTTELPREVVSCVTGGTNTGELHVKYTGTLSASVNTVIIIDVDGVRSDYSVSATFGRNNVWTGYRAIYHLNEASGNANDATGNALTLTNTTSKSYVASPMGRGIDMGSSIRNTTELTTTGILTSIGNLTMSVRFKMNLALSVSNGDPGLFILPYANASGMAVAMIPQWNGGSPRIAIIRRTASDATAFTSFGNDTTLWHNLHAVYDNGGNTISGYLDGVAFSTTAVASSGTFNATAYPISLGGSFMSSNATAILDEARVSNSAISSTWISTEYNNQNSSSTFYATGTIATAIVGLNDGVPTASIGRRVSMVGY